MSERLGHLDGLRGVAAGLVFYQHLVEHWAAAAAPAGAVHAHLAWLFTYLDLGKVGVVVFFAISGFVVPASFRGDAPRQTFLVSRLCRLFPAFWVTVLLAALVLPASTGAAVSSRQLLANLSMVPTLWAQQDLLGIFWTLRVEWVFYGLCVLLFTMGWLRSQASTQWLSVALLLFAVAAGVLRGGGHAPVPVALPLYLAVMLFGYQMRLALVDRDTQAARRWPWLLAALVVLIPAAWSLAYEDDSHKESVLADCTAFLAGLALFVACVRQRLFDRAWLRSLGRVSYGVYLLHPLALALFMVGPAGSLALLPARAFLTVVVALVAAHLLLHGIEQPAIRLGRRWVARLTPASPRERRA